jgi:hypothetical protein
MNRIRACGVALVVATSGCAALLGLDSGIAEEPDGSVESDAGVESGTGEAWEPNHEGATDAPEFADLDPPEGGSSDALRLDALRLEEVHVPDAAEGPPDFDGTSPADAADAARTPDSWALPDGESSDAVTAPDAACAYTACPDGCWDTATDPLRCGSCSQTFPFGANSQATCNVGVCGLACLGGALDCDHQPYNGCECPPAPNGAASCVAGGACAHVCSAGYVDCGGAPCNCGGGQRCLSNDTCVACRSTLQPCQLGTDCCSGACGAGLTCL